MLKGSNFPRQLLVLFLFLVTTVFLWEVALPFHALAPVGYFIVILYLIWFPFQRKYVVVLASIATLMIVLGFLLRYDQAEDHLAIAGVVRFISILTMWIAVYFNFRYGKALHQEIRYEDQLKAIFIHATEGILITDQSGKIVLINPLAEKLFGYQPGELFGANVDQLVPDKSRSRHRQQMQSFMSNPETRPMGMSRELVGKRKDGTEFPIEIGLSHFENQEGAFVIAFLIDLTEKRKVMENLSREQKLTQTYFELAPVLFVILDETGNVLSVNEYGSKLLGYPKENIVGKNWFQSFVPEGERGEAKNYFCHIESGSQIECICENPVLNNLGEEIEMSWKHTVYKDNNNQSVVLCAGIDISAKKKQEKQLIAHHEAIQNLNDALDRKIRLRTKELRDAIHNLEKSNSELNRNQKLLKAIVHYYPDGVIGVLNKDMRYIFADGQELHSLGLHDPATGERIFDNVHPALSIDSEEKLKMVFDGSRLSYDVEMAGHTYTVNSVPLPDDNGKINEIMVVIRNITERKRIETKLLKSIEKERELAVMKSRFVTMASHEFRTPLTTILSSAFLLGRYAGEELDSKKEVYLDKIKHAVNNMTELLNDFILLGKLEEGKVKINPTQIDLKEFQEELEQEVAGLKKEQQTISWQYKGIDKVDVYLDRQLLRSIFVNLMGNAFKYSPSESIINVIINVTNEVLKLQVIDQGIGIPKEEQSHIFTRFFRAQNAANIGGTGLGLNIARKHVKLMHGKIEFQSKLNEGTTFTVTLPLENTSKEVQPV